VVNVRWPKWLGANSKTAFARARAIVWLALGVVSWPLGWMNSVALVWMASVYANVESGFATGEAADDGKVTKRLDVHEALLREHGSLLREILDRLPHATEGGADEQEQRPRDERPDDETDERVCTELA
jgi:hypothetical protein